MIYSNSTRKWAEIIKGPEIIINGKPVQFNEDSTICEIYGFPGLNRKEIEAYTTNINVELRQIKKEIPDIKFKSAMLKIDSWKHLNKFVPKEYNHLLSQILRKVVHHWQHNLGGKLNEFTIKLK